MATSRSSQVPAVQGANEERKGGVQSSTSSARRSSQRRNVGESPDGATSSAGQQVRTVRTSGKKAVILTGGKQYLVQEGLELEVELLPSSSGKSVSFEALLVINGNDTSVGFPIVEGVKVNAEITEPIVKADKVTAIRYKAKKRVHKTKGHRQRLTRIKIKSVT